jgi:peptide/nickel transport system substrate-binding protein
MEAAGNGKVVASFGTGVERLMINQTNPDPALGDDRSVYMGGDNAHPFLTDPAVAEALSLAIDRNILVQVGYGFAGKASCNVLAGPTIYASTANDGCLIQNVAEANRLLDEAGWVLGADGVRAKDGVRLSILYQTSTNSVRQGTQALLKQMWEAIGVETELRNIDAGVFFGGDPASPDTYGKFYADIQMYTNSFSGTDPEQYMAGIGGCDTIPGPENQWIGNNIMRLCSEEYDALVDQMALTADSDERIALAKQMNDMIVQNYGMIALIHRGDVSGIHNSLLGFRMNSWDSEMWNIADWSRAGQ